MDELPNDISKEIMNAAIEGAEQHIFYLKSYIHQLNQNLSMTIVDNLIVAAHSINGNFNLILQQHISDIAFRIEIVLTHYKKTPLRFNQSEIKILINACETIDIQITALKKNNTFEQMRPATYSALLNSLNTLIETYQMKPT